MTKDTFYILDKNKKIRNILDKKEGPCPNKINHMTVVIKKKCSNVLRFNSAVRMTTVPSRFSYGV